MERAIGGHRSIVVAGLLGIALLLAAAGAARAQVTGPSAFEQIKRLEGEWEADWSGREYGGTTQPLRVRYQVTTGGTIVRETSMPGTPQEMTTQYYLDGPDLLVTHFCLFGNQPTMGLESSLSTSASYRFSLRRVTGLMGHGGCLYMVLEAIDFLSPTDLRTHWATYQEDGALIDTHSVVLRKLVNPPPTGLQERRREIEAGEPGTTRQR
jgi:hypothetical protein